MDKPHKRLIAWQKSMDLVVLTYRVTATFPDSEEYGLTSQMRRAAVSAPSNIAEGAAGRSVAEFKRFLTIALGTLNELSTQCEVAYRVKYIGSNSHDDIQELIDTCLAVTYGLRRSL